MMSSQPHFVTAILKLTSFCNLNCTYCYMFNLADRTYERIADHMPAMTAVNCVNRLGEHVRAHGGKQMQIVLHGGEPSLWALESFVSLFQEVSAQRASGLTVDVSLQTNGIHLRRELVDLLMENEVTLGFSLDGPEKENDRFRVTHGGSGSYARVIDGLEQTMAWGFDRRKIGILSVINTAVEPDRYLEWAAGLPVKNITPLWPIEFSWDNPPWASGDLSAYAQAPRYGVWLADVFGQWWEDYLEKLYIRQFVDTIGRLMGSRQHSDSIGNDFVNMFVLNTDGIIEYPDYFRAHRDGGTRTNLSINHTDLDTVSQDHIFQTLLHLRESLPEECGRCTHADVCGGGFLAGRSGTNGFDVNRRSVLCYDQFYYFQSVSETIQPYLESLDAVS